MKHTGIVHEHALEVLGAEKSFLVIAESETCSQDWLIRIAAAKVELGLSAPASSAAVGVAPVWVQDHLALECCICQVVYK